MSSEPTLVDFLAESFKITQSFSVERGNPNIPIELKVLLKAYFQYRKDLAQDVGMLISNKTIITTMFHEANQYFASNYNEDLV